MGTSMTTDGQIMRRWPVLSASDIDQCRFAMVRRGYDVAAVDDLLDRVASKIHRVEREVAELRLDRRRQDGELEAARQRISELELHLAEAQAEADEAQQHTETTRQMFDRDLRSGAARVHELERAIEQARAQAATHIEQARAKAATQAEALSERLADVERGAQSAHERAETLGQQLEEALAERQRVVDELEARRAQIERERDEARGLIAELHQANEQRAADDEALGEEVARLWTLIGDLRDGLSVRHAEDNTRIEAVEDQLGTLEGGPLQRFIRPA